MSPRRHAAHRADRGATMVEFAFIGSLLFLFLFAIIQFAIVEIGNSATGDAARDGARAGIVSPDCVDSYTLASNAVATTAPGGANHDAPNCVADTNANYLAVKSAVIKHLVGLVGTPAITIGCFRNSSTGIGSQEDCYHTHITPDTDLLQVTVDYDSKVTSAFIPAQRHHLVARMSLLVPPSISATTTSSTSAPPTSACTISTVSYSPSPATTINGSGVLNSDESVSITTNGNSDCNAMQVFFAPDGPVQGVIATGPPASLTATLPGTPPPLSTWQWSPGTIQMYFRARNNALLAVPVGQPTSFQVIGVPPPTTTCTITSVSYSPSPALLPTGSGNLSSDESITITTNADSACQNIKVAFKPGDGSTQTATASAGSSPYTATLPGTTSGSWSWKVGTVTLTFAASNNAPLAVPPGQDNFLVVPAPVPCTILSVTYNPTAGSLKPGNGNAGKLSNNEVLTITTTGTGCGALKVSFDPGFGGVQQATVTGTGPTFTATMPATPADTTVWHWVAGTIPVGFKTGSGSPILAPSGENSFSVS